LNKKIFVLGSGGHASVLVDILTQQQKNISGLAGPNEKELRENLVNLKRYQDADLLAFNKDEILLINGIGSIPESSLRLKLYNKFIQLGYLFKSVISSKAIVSPHAFLGIGVQIMQGAIIQAGAKIGDNTIINSGAIIDHDCIIGCNNHIAPGVTLSGQVESKNNVHFGTGSSVIQSVLIGENCVIGAGATITKDIEDNQIVYPARVTKKALK
jgi:sugar O-acyltransferase (sialic acid O-acetyltransferase NeuD family)